MKYSSNTTSFGSKITRVRNKYVSEGALGPRPRGPRVAGPRAGRFVRFWASEGAKFTKMRDSLPWTPMNRRAKFDAASFILGGEIRNRTKKERNKQTVNLAMCE